MNLPRTDVGCAVASDRPRIGIFSLRNSALQVARSPGYEFEETIVGELEPNAVLVEPPLNISRDQLGLRAKRWFKRRGVGTGPINFGAQTWSVEQDFDLFFVAPAFPNDLLELSTLRDWRKRSRVAICYLQELWVSDFDNRLPTLMSILKEFDYIFVGLYHTAEALSKKLGIDVQYLPLGIDAEMWNPYTGTPKPRDIDVCAIGNMDPGTHEALWNWAEEKGRYYSFTTTGGGRLTVNHRIHRQNLAQTLKRSKFFFTFMAKRDVTSQRGSQEEFGPRYYEGAGAGAILLGDAVKTNPAYLKHMDWEGAVIEVPYASVDMPTLLEEIEKNADWLEDVRRRNVANCLTRHDHLNRWDMVMKAAGFEETPTAAARRARLKEQAAMLQGASPVPLGRPRSQVT